MFCPCLFGVLFLFGVLLINGQHHYLVFSIWPHIWMGAVLVLHICRDNFHKCDNLVLCYCNFWQSTTPMIDCVQAHNF